ncbi:MAG: flagellar biosynthesis protein FliR [Synergistaceae bacterium]|jgi:hypothetical protein|nr:flagellar biosynthesis protein FliR [Synergistaceae bacterium]
MPQNNVYALMGLASFVGALLVAQLAILTQKGKAPGGDLWVVYLRALLGFLLTAAIVFGWRAFS